MIQIIGSVFAIFAALGAINLLRHAHDMISAEQEIACSMRAIGACAVGALVKMATG